MYEYRVRSTGYQQYVLVRVEYEGTADGARDACCVPTELVPDVPERPTPSVDYRQANR